MNFCIFFCYLPITSIAKSVSSLGEAEKASLIRY